MQRMHYQENAWNEHSLFAFFVRNEFTLTGMRVLDELYGLRQEAKSPPYISLNGDLAKLRIERKIVPFSLFLKLNKKCKRKSPNQKGQGFIVI